MQPLNKSKKKFTIVRRYAFHSAGVILSNAKVRLSNSTAIMINAESTVTTDEHKSQ